MSLQEFNLGGGGVSQMYPLMERFMESISQSAEKIGGGIRSAMLQTEANSQTKDMAEKIKGTELFNPDGTSKPDSMTNLMGIMAAHPLGSQTPTGRMMFEGLGRQIEYNMPIGGQPSTGSAGGAATQSASGDQQSGGLGRVTTYSPTEPGADIDTRNGLSAIGKLTPLSLAVSPDVESELTKKGLKIGDPVTVELSNGQKVQRIWDDRTSNKLQGRVDFNTPEGENPHEGASVVNIMPQSSGGAASQPSSPMDMFREQVTTIDKRMALLQSMLPKAITKGNHVTFNATQAQIDKLQTQKDNLIKDEAIQTRSEARETLSQAKSDRDERRLDQADRRIELAEKRGDSAEAAKLRTEHRENIKAQISPLEKGVAVLETQLRYAKKDFETYSSAATQETDSRKQGAWQKKAREAQKEMQSLQAEIKPKQDQIMGLSARLETLDKSAEQPGKSLDGDTAKAILTEAGGDKDKARQLAKERGYSL